MSKSADAFRTISEVAEWLGVQTHVLRFWESKFTQIKPVKRAGGRRYYRPADMLLLGGIRKLLHDDGMTIKGVQKLLREEGMAYVADMSAPLDDETAAQIDDDYTPDADFVEAEDAPEPTADTVTPFVPIAPSEPAAEEPAAPEPTPSVESEPAAAHAAPVPEPDAVTPTADAPPMADETNAPEEPGPASPPPDPAPVPEDPVDASPDPIQQDPPEEPRPRFARTPDPAPPVSSSGLLDEDEDPVAMPSFLTGRKQSPDSGITPEDAAPSVAAAPAPEPPEPKPRIVEVPDAPDPASIKVAPSALSKVARIAQLHPEQRDAIRPLLVQLTALRDQMASASGDSR